MRSSLVRWWRSRAVAQAQARLEAEMEEEMRFHTAMEEQYLAMRGAAPGEAKRRARIVFGGEERFKEEIREAMPLRWLSDLRADVAFALRSLRRSPGFTAFAVIALGVGIGANATAFGFIDSVAFRKLPVPNPDRMVALYGAQGDQTLVSISYPNFEDLKRSVSSFEDAAAFIEGAITVSDDPSPSVAWAVHASDNYFSVLGIEAERGRLLRRGDQNHRVAVISHAYWKREYGSDPRIVGRNMSIDGIGFRIIGVAPKAFRGTRLFTYDPSVWLTIGDSNPAMAAGITSNRGRPLFNVIARLESKASLSGARREANSAAARLSRTHADTNSGLRFVILSNESPINPWLAPRRRIELLGRLLLVCVCMVLFVACADVANLLLTRMTVRRHEITTRIALGVSTSRLLRQLLAESFVLVILGVAAAIPLAFIALKASIGLAPPLDFPISFEPAFNKRVLVFTLGVSLFAVIAFGMAPLIQLWWRELNPDKHNTAGNSGASGSKLRAGFVVAQVAISIIAIASAGLLNRGLSSARAIDVGFDTKDAVSFTLDASSNSPNRTKDLRDLYRRLKSELSSVKGVESATIASSIPLDGDTRTLNVRTHRDASGVSADYFLVDDDYFKTMRIPVSEGQTFSASDTSVEEPVIVNEVLARQLWGTASPIGARLEMGRSDAMPAVVIGVSSSIASRRLGDAPRAILWRSMRRALSSRLSVVVRSTPEADLTRSEVDAVIQRIDPMIPVLGFRSLEDRVALAYNAAENGAIVGTIFGTLTTILAAVGLFGGLIYNVTQRTREIGIRRALGASSTDVLKLVTASSVRLTLIGIAIGLIAIGLIPRRISAILYGVSPHDPMLLVVTSIAFLLVALLAALGPAWKAIRIEPNEAMRLE